MDNFAPPRAVLLQDVPCDGFAVRVQPTRMINLPPKPTQSLQDWQSIEPLGGGVEINDAIAGIEGDDRIADLPEHLATNPARVRVVPLERINLWSRGALDCQRIHLVAADGAERFLRFRQPEA